MCILVCDLTRPMETERVLPLLLERIERNAPGAKITILIALGTHRGLSDEEIDKLCGKGIREKCNVVNHAFDDPDALVQIPCDREDMPPVFVNKILTECDLRVAVGAVKPHPIFGWSGGAKIVIPGVAGYETTGYSHWLTCPHKGIEVMGKEDNPVRLLYESIVVKAHLVDFILNAVLTEESKISDVRCGRSGAGAPRGGPHCQEILRLRRGGAGRCDYRRRGQVGIRPVGRLERCLPVGVLPAQARHDRTAR